MLTVFVLGIFFGVSISVLFLYVIIRWSGKERVKIRKRGLVVTEHWLSGITKEEMKNYVN
jgi:hypothetical protein